MRGRKRQRKKDAKRRGIWRLPIIVTPKRGSGYQDTADAIAKLAAYLLRKDFAASAKWTMATLYNNDRVLMGLDPLPEGEAAGRWQLRSSARFCGPSVVEDMAPLQIPVMLPPQGKPNR